MGLLQEALRSVRLRLALLMLEIVLEHEVETTRREVETAHRAVAETASARRDLEEARVARLAIN